MKDMLKKIDYRHYICIALVVISTLCVLLFPYCFIRIWEAIRDFGTSLAYYFCELFFENNNINATVTEYSKTPFTFPGFPEDLDEFKYQAELFFTLLVRSDNMLAYLSQVGIVLYNVSKIITMLLWIYIVLKVILQQYVKTQNNDYNTTSKNLIRFRKFEDRVYVPIKNWIKDFISFVASKKNYLIALAVIWSIYFNIFSILLETLAYYFYFAMSFDLPNIFVQAYKLMCDLSVMIEFIPGIIWLIVGLVMFDIICKYIAKQRLNHYENKNRGFINERPIVAMIIGTMGKQKTTAMTDMALSQNVMFRDKAFEMILENDLKFPNFPWINLENEIKKAMDKHSVYNLATAKRFIESKEKKFIKKPCKRNIFMYDVKRYGYQYDDKLKVVDVWSVLKSYTQLYFLYVIKSCLILSNYSVRTDDIINDVGNFPMWDHDFFAKDSRLLESFSRHSKILDYDSLRLGKKLLEDNKYVDSFEFGVIILTEIGKERQNTLELREIKKISEETNQKNDLFTSWLKMVRHSATIDNVPFVKVIMDEQRADSLGANDRELCDIIHINEVKESKLTLPLFTLRELIHDGAYNNFQKTYYEYRYNRADNTLFMYLYHNIMAKFHGYYNRIKNRFGYHQLKLAVEKGTQDGMLGESKYYIMNKKIYSNRFSTDCFADFFVQKALRSPVGIEDLPEYVSDKATLDELASQHSYFINDLFKNFDVKYLK